MDVPEDGGLTRDEDDSLRRLAYFAENAGLSEWSEARLKELRARDRRDDIRLPREIMGDFEEEARETPAPADGGVPSAVPESAV